jgi:dihydrodipicolinate synthase/N-acetylneuraminate lyase
MLSYYTRIFDKYKLPIYPVVIYLYPDRLGFDIPDSYVSSVNNKDILAFKFEVLKAWEIKANRIKRRICCLPKFALISGKSSF